MIYLFFAESVLDYSPLLVGVSFDAGSVTGDKQCFNISITNDEIREVGNEVFYGILVNPVPLLDDIIFTQPNVTITIADCKCIELQ